MNLPKFLTAVDSYTKEMSHIELESFIHHIACVLPEEKRADFIEILKIEKQITEPNSVKIQLKNQIQPLLKQLSEIEQELDKIEAGDSYLIGNENEYYYHDWYDDEEEDEEDEYEFEDPDGLLLILDKAIQLVHQCVDNELYKEGYILANRLTTLPVYVEGEYSDYYEDDLLLSDLNDYELLKSDFDQFVLDALYLAYMGNELKERSEILYQMMVELGNVTLENILQHGKEELEQFDEFLMLWIEYLSNLSERYAEKFLLEAYELVGDNEELLLANARKYVKKHPSLYRQYLLQTLGDRTIQKLFEVGMEALSAISSTYTIRSEIALLTANYALQLNKTEGAEQCWVEAFCSNTAAINYMRLYLECKDYSKYKEKIKKQYEYIAERRKIYNISFPSEELRENCITEQEYCTLLFLDGEFEILIRKYMNVKEALGWSMTFMKKGIALLLLSLFQGKELPVGLKYMAESAIEAFHFSVEEYQKGLNTKIKEDNFSFFWNRFCEWNKKQNRSEKEKEELVAKLEKWISYRVEGIMQGNHRKYYGECASFIAALGEVKEYRGELLGKQNFMQSYKIKYPRRTAFHQELYNFGLVK